MSSYVKSTNFSSKDSLPSGNPGKIVKGTEIDTEFNNIATAVNSKSDSSNPVFTGVVEIPDGSASAPSLTNTGDTNTGVFFPAGDTIGFANGGSETARIDSSGNLGLGVTPSAWSGSPHNGRVLQTGGAAFFGRTDNSDAYVSTNAYRDATNWKYIATAPAAYYHQSQNTHLWFIAPSGTAGNAITWTEAMRLDTSGNLGVGTTSPSSFGALCTRRGIAVTNVTGSVSASFSDGANDTLYVSQDSSLSRLTFATLTFNTGTTERSRIDSSGNLLVGTTSSDARLNVKGSGSTSSTFSLIVRNSASGDIVKTRDDGYVYLPSTYNNTSASAANIFMGGSGELYRSTSSLKYKTNVQDATHGLADLLKLRSVTYQGKSEADAGKTFGGLIAEEVDAAGLTEFVQYAEDGSPDALAYGNMVSLCIKAIQEQQAIIEQLKADVAALKGA